MTAFTATDHLLMARALRLAERGAYTTKPNPMVGCVLAKNDQIIGEGWHVGFGKDHAEPTALHDCKSRGNDPAGATNAGLLAASILALNDAALSKRLEDWRKANTAAVAEHPKDE